MAYQEKIAPTDPAPISEPADVLLFERSTESEQENVWLKEKLARIKGAKPLQ
jgi:hypothetical protein